jgi:hypothetical protein
MRLVVSKLFGHIEGARAVAASHDVPRVLVHAAWSFLEQREEFSLWPSFAAFDIVAKTNNQKKPLMQMAGLDNDGPNRVSFVTRQLHPTSSGFVTPCPISSNPVLC